MSGYTPTTDQVRAVFIAAPGHHTHAGSRHEAFERWLASITTPTPPEEREHEHLAQMIAYEGAKLEARNLMRHDPHVWHEALEDALDKVLPGVWRAAAGYRRSEVPEPSADRDEITDEALWDFADDLLDAWNIEDTNAPSLAEDFRDRFVARFHPSYRSEPQGEPNWDTRVQKLREAVAAQTGSYLSIEGAEAILETVPSEPRGEPSDAQVRSIRMSFANELTRLGVYTLDIHEIRKRAAGGER